MQVLKTMSLYQYYISIQIFNGIKKTIHHTINITLTEAELFATRYGINQAV